VSGTIKVLLADDQALVRGALAALLALEPDLEVVAEVGRGDEVVAAARASGADVSCSTSRCRAPTASPRLPPCATPCPACARSS
jgi:phage terminase large subunit-like protein